MPRAGSRGPGRPLDDDWLFTDPMAIDWSGGRDAELMPAQASVVHPSPSRRPIRLLAAVLIFAGGMLAGAMVSGSWHARLSFSAVPCPQALATDTGSARPVPEHKG